MLVKVATGWNGNAHESPFENLWSVSTAESFSPSREYVSLELGFAPSTESVALNPRSPGSLSIYGKDLPCPQMVCC